jgi:hypothetical protein
MLVLGFLGSTRGSKVSLDTLLRDKKKREAMTMKYEALATSLDTSVCSPFHLYILHFFFLCVLHYLFIRSPKRIQVYETA